MFLTLSPIHPAPVACVGAELGRDKQAVWSLSDDRWSIFLAVMVGGLLATLHTRGDGMTLSAQTAFGPLCVGALVGYAYNETAALAIRVPTAPKNHEIESQV